MSERGRSWAWSNQHNGKFWSMWSRLAELEQRVAKMQKAFDALNPPVEGKISLAMKTLFSDHPASALFGGVSDTTLPYSYLRTEQEATEP